jgi:RimK family alpha-L-glutamate ligase
MQSMVGYTSVMAQNKDLPFILLNCGPSTREGFSQGLRDTEYKSYRTKEMLIHIEANGTPVFFYENMPISLEAAYVFIRLRATDSHFCGMLTEYLHHHSIRTNDPIHLAYPHSAEKISQMMLLSLAGIRVPETHVFREESFVANREYLKNTLSFPLIYKTDGSKGKNVELLQSFDELEQKMQKKLPYRLAIVQPFIENTFDTRTLVFGDEILGSISRTRTKGYLNNISQGAGAAVYALTDEEKDIAIRAAKACRIDFGGVDMIHTAAGPVVLEVNKSPQVGGFESVHNFKVMSKIAQIIKQSI